MAEIRTYNASSLPGSPHKNSAYFIEDNTNLEVHFVDSSGNNTFLKPATVIAALGATTNLTAVPGSFADEAAVQTYLVTLRADVESRLDAIEAKVDAFLAAQKTAGLMKTS